MKIVVLHGQMHRGSTYHLVHQVLDHLTGEGKEKTVQEFFMPRDAPAPCVGCYRCFLNGEETCPHEAKVQPLVHAIREADLIVLDSPCYVGGMTGQLKTVLDHLAYLWMSHRPEQAMFNKVGLVVSTTAGVGAGKVTKALASNLFFWGVPRIYKLPLVVAAMNWAMVKPAMKEKMARKAKRVAKRIDKQLGRAKPGFKTRMMFRIMRLNQKSNEWNPLDKAHWEDKGWLGRIRPW
ncbi:NAD(P)H-dependent oxidoreductase [Gorillibacterium sp. CAU 1737]|uniref:flavodoxin family protein n=1 Tax=Gorillibacterium sp. CAU 1737 TaxID=3140362 RepID=UPI003260B5C3